MLRASPEARPEVRRGQESASRREEYNAVLKGIAKGGGGQTGFRAGDCRITICKRGGRAGRLVRGTLSHTAAHATHRAHALHHAALLATHHAVAEEPLQLMNDPAFDPATNHVHACLATVSPAVESNRRQRAKKPRKACVGIAAHPKYEPLHGDPSFGWGALWSMILCLPESSPQFVPRPHFGRGGQPQLSQGLPSGRALSWPTADKRFFSPVSCRC